MYSSNLSTILDDIELPSDPFIEACSIDTDSWNQCDQGIPITEAVFSGGKQTVQPLVQTLQEIKDLLDHEVELQETSIKNARDAEILRKNGEKMKQPKIVTFDPKKFWKDELFKKLEDQLAKIFGFRNVQVHPFIEKYISKDKVFESRDLNCAIYHMDRFPIEGLVTEKGFYDKSRSVSMEIHLTLGLIKILSAEEILAVLLHEFGHSIDPALVDIKYTEINVLSKYLTDRKNAINKQERKLMNRHKFSYLGITLIGIVFLYIGMTVKFGIGKLISLITGKPSPFDRRITEKRLQIIRKMVENDKTTFDRQSYSEAYADNFARMYGYGAQLITSLKKITKQDSNRIRSRCKKEQQRQECILYITAAMLKDEHKTDLHRIRNLIREYKLDIDDPNTPPIVKKQLEDDLSELEKILDEYLHNFSRFQNRVNRIINEELEKIEIQEERKQKTKDKTIKEGFQFFDESDEVFEEKHPLQEKMEKKCPLEHGDRTKIDEKFGKSKSCSWAKDKKGYFCYTHRCRSKSYPTIDEIPQEDVDFVRSTC